ncbi:MAG: hypothetical protein P4L84_11045 [Isosphaeraceae bacterium]|nr:hypothetical protein [Isosphaeraceae bacterium]
MTGTSIGHERLWYKVRHPAFDEGMAYRAIVFVPPYSETGWSYLTFVLLSGHTYTVQVWRCTGLPRQGTFVDDDRTSRPLTKAESEFPWAAKPARPNPDLETDL